MDIVGRPLFCLPQVTALEKTDLSLTLDLGPSLNLSERLFFASWMVTSVLQRHCENWMESFHQPLGTSLELQMKATFAPLRSQLIPYVLLPRLLHKDRILLLSPSALGYIWSSCQQAILKDLHSPSHSFPSITWLVWDTKSASEQAVRSLGTWSEKPGQNTLIFIIQRNPLCVSFSLCISPSLNLLMTVPGWTQET